MTRMLNFSKLHGLGNDFILINNLDGSIKLSTEDAVFLCDRRFGIGADGIMMVEKAADPSNDFSWYFANADGSFPEMCGNGIRAFALYIKSRGLIPADQKSILIETLAGLMVAEFSGDDSVRVDMGRAVSKRDDSWNLLKENDGQLIDVDLSLEGAPLHLRDYFGSLSSIKVSAVSMGNPHLILFVDELGLDLSDETIQNVGRFFESHPAFPAKVNVEFVRVHNPREIEMRVFERGVGETLACGTGACAVAFAAFKKGLSERQSTVKLRGGNLEIEIESDDRIFMTGPAKEVFSGVIALP